MTLRARASRGAPATRFCQDAEDVSSHDVIGKRGQESAPCSFFTDMMPGENLGSPRSAMQRCLLARRVTIDKSFQCSR